MKTKPFDLEAAMNGAKLVTRDGREAKFIAYVPETDPEVRVLVLVGNVVIGFYENGNRYRNSSESGVDLFLAVQTRSINGYEYPEPERVAPSVGTRYWCPNPYTDDAHAWSGAWSDQEIQKSFLRKGLVHLTQEAAEDHARAIILACGGEV